jgi:glycerol-3-phosphate dehydrogenase (NAD(P)+)
MTQSADQTPQNIVVLGAGAWGVVIAGHLARLGNRVVAWDFSEKVVGDLERDRAHSNLPGFHLPKSVVLRSDFAESLNFEGLPNAASPHPDCAVVVVPSHGVRDLAKNWKALAAKNPALRSVPWVVCAKGIEEESLLPMTGVVESVWGEGASDRVAALSGPSFAAEVGVGKPTTVCVASANPDLAARAQRLFMSESFRVYTQEDLLGVELGGSLKNVVAIAAGCCDGLGLGDNARAALITRGLAEMIRLGVAMGAKAETFAGLTGMGDLILTCCGPLSRNRSFGTLLAKGRSPQEAMKQIGMVVEGVRTARSARELAKRHGVNMPIVEQVFAVVHEDKSPLQAVRDLMSREARPE